MPINLNLQPKSPKKEPESFDSAQNKEPGDFTLELDPESANLPKPPIESKPNPVSPAPTPPTTPQNPISIPVSTPVEKPGLNWEFQNLNPDQNGKKTWNFWTILGAIFKFILINLLSFSAIFIATLFIVGEFYDPIPSILKALKWAGIISGALFLYIIYLFWKKNYLVAISLILSIILALGIFYLGLLYYQNNQTLPIFETLLSWFGL